MLARSLTRLRTKRGPPHLGVIWPPDVHHILQRQYGRTSTLFEEGPNQKSKIRWFEQNTEDGRRRRLGPDEDIDPEAAHLQAELAQVEKEIHRYETEPISADSPLLKDLSPQDRTKALEALRLFRSQAQHEQTGPRKEKAQDPGSKDREKVLAEDAVSIHMSLSRQNQVLLDQLNQALRQAQLNPNDPTKGKSLWRWYSRCKQALPPFIHLIESPTWEVFWACYTEDGAMNADRASHIVVLVEDMFAGGHKLSPSQKLAHIDALFCNGQHSIAVNKWEIEQSTLGSDADNFQAYWKLGVKMYCSLKDPAKAEQLANLLLSSRDGKDVRILLPVILAWTEQGDMEAYRNAWALYLRLRDRLGAQINMDDYDAVSMSFLKAGRSDLALAVFKDMMLTGEKSTQDSTMVYKKALGLLGNMQSQSADGSEINKISLEAMTVLPRRFQNKFFFASWLKKLLGMHEIDAAVQVVELMYERGVRPDAKHLNGVIGAWLRDGNAGSRKKAEVMAWSMIKERLEFVWRRRVGHIEDTSGALKDLKDNLEDEVFVPNFLDRPVPPATVETFCILVLYYARRTKYNYVAHLQKLLQKAELRPNSYFMNHLLYAELRRNGHRAAWARYKEMSSTVSPDLETFTCLWECMKAHVGRSSNEGPHGFPTPRELFSLMVEWKSSLKGRALEKVREDFEISLYDQIIRTFGLSKDLEGTLVALHTLRESFGQTASEGTPRLVVLQIARMGISEAAIGNQKRSSALRKASKANVARISVLLEELATQRNKILEESGVDLDQVDAVFLADEMLFIVSTLIKFVLYRTGESDALVKENIGRAALDMGVSGIDLGENPK